MTRHLLVLAGALAALVVPAAAQAATVATPGAATAVRAHAGTIVFSQFTDGAWHLAVRRPGAAPELVPVAPQARPFDADIGPDSEGRPELIYTRCAPGCDLYVFSLDGGTGERPVRNANDPSHDDTRPTLWRGRIAWTRDYGDAEIHRPVVYTKLLTAARSTPSTQLPGVPLRRCGDVQADVCGPTNGRFVDALELWGNNLAQVVSYGCRGCGGISQTELRMVRVATRQSILVAWQMTGLGGQRLVGPSFTNGWLGWQKTCLGDPAGCAGDRHGPYRFSLSNGSYAKAAPDAVKVDGYADTGATEYEVLGCSEETEPQLNAGCRIDQHALPTFTRTAAPLRPR